jgi:hypothetical protein
MSAVEGRYGGGQAPPLAIYRAAGLVPAVCSAVVTAEAEYQFAAKQVQLVPRLPVEGVGAPTVGRRDTWERSRRQQPRGQLLKRYLSPFFSEGSVSIAFKARCANLRTV